MKNKILLMALLLPIMFLTSCGDDDASIAEPTYDNLVRFNEQSVEVGEASGTTLSIPVVMNNFATQDVSVSYSLTGDAANYELLSNSGTVSIPAGTRQGFIRLKPVDNFDYNDPLNTLVITLTGVSGADAVLADSFYEYTIVFADNDCPPITAGTYAAVTNSGTYNGGTATVEITDLGGGKYQVSDITFGLYPGGYGSAANPGVFTQSSCALTIVEDESPDVVYGGDWFFGDGSFNGSNKITLSWANYYGDNGNTTLTLQ